MKIQKEVKKKKIKWQIYLRMKTEESYEDYKDERNLKIENIYSNPNNYIKTRNNQTEEFMTRKGLKHGGVLIPTLFNIYMEDIIKESNKNTKGLCVRYRNMPRIILYEYAC